MIIFPSVTPAGEEIEDSENTSVRQPQALSHKERRLERLRSWRVANREYLREYLHNWKATHPDRVKIHREREYAQRRRRRRLRLRREAQRRRRALQRSTLRRNIF